MRRIELRRRKDGSTFWNRTDGRALDPQNPHKGSVWTVEDVTEQRRAEEELQRVLAEQQALLDNVVVGIAISRSCKIVRCNRRLRRCSASATARRRRRGARCTSPTGSSSCARR
jgi:PAS domain-containing protein